MKSDYAGGLLLAAVELSPRYLGLQEESKWKGILNALN
jgi:hypothetical protein